MNTELEGGTKSSIPVTICVGGDGRREVKSYVEGYGMYKYFIIVVDTVPFYISFDNLPPPDCSIFHLELNLV